MVFRLALTLALCAVVHGQTGCASTDFPVTLGPNYYEAYLCQEGSFSYPSRQEVSITATFHGGGYDIYDVYLTSGPSCQLSPVDSSFSYEYGRISVQTATYTLPTTSCGPVAPCCVVMWCRNSALNCILTLNYILAQPPPPSATPTPTPSRTPSQTLAPSLSVGASPSRSNSNSFTPSPSPRPSTAPQYSRNSCTFTDTFTLPSTSQSDNFMFLTCKNPGAPLSLNAYASAQMTNPNQCNVSFVGSTSCDLDPIENSPSLGVGFFWATQPTFSFSNLDCGGGNSPLCCVMLWTDPDDGGCEGLGLTWKVQRQSSRIIPPMASRVPFARPTFAPQDSGDGKLPPKALAGLGAGIAAFFGLLFGAYRQRDGIKQCLGCTRMARGKEYHGAQGPSVEAWPQQQQQQQEQQQIPGQWQQQINPIQANGRVV